MGISTNAMLVYGYDLGGADHGWRVTQVDDDGKLVVNWPTYEDDGFQEAAETALLAAAGFTETDWNADGYYDRMRAAKARHGVEVDSYCSGDYPSWVLVAESVTAYRGDSKQVDFGALNARAAAEDWDGKLAAALAVLGLTPTQEQPQWLLASYWG